MKNDKTRRFFNFLGFLGGLWLVFEGYQNYRDGVEFFGIHSGGIGLIALGTVFCLLNVYIFFKNR